MASKDEATLLVKIKEEGAKALNVTFKGMIGAVGAVAAAIGAAGAALGALALKAGEFDGVKKAFNNLAESQGQDARKMLAQMKQLSAGTVSELDLMKQANQALLLGLPVDRMGDMLKIARSAAQATGRTLQESLQDITTGLGRQSKLVLDNLGIVFKLEDAYKDYAKQIGKTAESLTEAEKKQAFINKALQVGTANAQKAGNAQLTMAEAFQQAKAQLSDIAIVIGEAVGPSFAFLTQRVGELFASMNNGVGAETISSFFQFSTKAGVIFVGVLQQVANIAMGVFGGIANAAHNLLAGRFRAAANSIERAWQETGSNMVSTHEQTVKDLNDIDNRYQIAAQERQDEHIAAMVAKKQVAHQAEVEQEAVWDEEKKAAEFERAAAELDLIGATSDQKLAYAQKNLDDQLKTATTSRQKEAIMQAKYQVLEMQRQEKLREFEKQEQAIRTQAMNQFLTGVASLQNAKTKELAAIGKAAAIFQATQAAYVAINNALATVPYPFSYAAAAGIGIQAFVQVSKIAGLELAEGGIIPATQGGVQATIGEGGRSEAVIPLPDNFDPDRGLGGGMTINFYGPVLGDDSQARAFAIKLDEEFLKLRQNNESVAFDQGVS